MLTELFARLDETARIEEFYIFNNVRDDKRGKTFSVADDGIGCLRGQIVDKVNALENIPQLIEQSHDTPLRIESQCFIRDNTFDHV